MIRVIYVLVITVPLAAGVLVLPNALSPDFFQVFAVGGFLGLVVNVVLLLRMGNDFVKKYDSLGERIRKIHADPNVPKVELVAAKTMGDTQMDVNKWHHWFAPLIYSSAASLLISGVMFWIMSAGALVGKFYFLLSLLPMLIGMDALFAAMFYHSLLQFLRW